jgi:hypothetical protein
MNIIGFWDEQPCFGDVSEERVISISGYTQDALQHNQNSHTLDPEHIDGNQPHLMM